MKKLPHLLLAASALLLTPCMAFATGADEPERAQKPCLPLSQHTPVEWGAYLFQGQGEAYTQNLRRLLAETQEIVLCVRYSRLAREADMVVSIRGVALAALREQLSAVPQWCLACVSGYVHFAHEAEWMEGVSASFRNAAGEELLRQQYNKTETYVPGSLAWFDLPLGTRVYKPAQAPTFLIDCLLPHLPEGWRKPTTAEEILVEIEAQWSEPEQEEKTAQAEHYHHYPEP